MNMALSAVPGVFAPLQGLWRWFTSSTAQARHTASDPGRRIRGCATHLPVDKTPCSKAAPQEPFHASARRPLRVVRILETGQAPAQAGRMAISGRMADVCAELDRLVAREAALH
jgi:hypothetical protein